MGKMVKCTDCGRYTDEPEYAYVPRYGGGKPKRRAFCEHCFEEAKAYSDAYYNNVMSRESARTHKGEPYFLA